MEQSIIKQMLNSYMKEKMVELEQAIAAQDFVALKDLGHKIKGNSGSLALGLEEINDIGRIIEKNSGTETMDPIKEGFEALKIEIKKLD